MYILIFSIKHVKKAKLWSVEDCRRWQHSKNASMVKMITIKNSLRLVTSIKVSRLTIWNKVII